MSLFDDWKDAVRRALTWTRMHLLALLGGIAFEDHAEQAGRWSATLWERDRTIGRLNEDLANMRRYNAHLYDELKKAIGVNRPLASSLYKVKVEEERDIAHPATIVTLTARPWPMCIQIIGPMGVALLQDNKGLANLYALQLADAFGYPVYASIMEQLGHDFMGVDDYRSREARSWEGHCELPR